MNRTQRIKIRSTFSGWTNIVKGIPQGSIVGPLLFNIFNNHLFLFSMTIMNLDNIFTNLIQDM